MKNGVFAAVYANPNPTQKNTLWDNLEETAESMDKPWLVVGDFNDYGNLSERRSFSIRHNTTRSQKNLDRVDKCNLIDLGSFGPNMTWTNNKQGMANTVERLDQAMCNADWRAMFLEATIRVLSKTYSDHSPLVVYTQGMHSLTPPLRPFRFEAAWMSHPSLPDIIESAWTTINHNLIDSMNEFTQKVKIWNREVFGNIFKSKRRILARIEGIQRSQAVNFNHNLHHLERDLVSQYNYTLFQEKDLFNWVDTNHLANWSNTTKNKFTNEENDGLLKPLTNFEIWKATKAIGAYKAPGKDGIQAVFYHHYWTIVGKSICDFVRTCFSDQQIPKEINETLIVLIPKVEYPTSIKQFYPISLCNVTYKIITKLVVNRIRPLLDNIIGPNQSSSIPGHSTTDNIIITQDIIHTLRHRKGKINGIIFKIDLEKAYDRLSWKFVYETLIEFGPNMDWINLIMSCITVTTPPRIIISF
ncbi:uncharacterized protein LOC114281340 [Camellia sinensis]|uniref:uncharacterized protein LOC114281340 n=1 Tax=Camellia sinensis TaxID=4442 RepID=UPI001035896D|nr:uncharacterized protein LOC114281340 [Camellia sinensis]